MGEQGVPKGTDGRVEMGMVRFLLNWGVFLATRLSVILAISIAL